MNSALAEIAARRHGVVSRRAAREAGISSDSLAVRLASGMLSTLTPGVYRFEGSPFTWRSRVVAACDACGPTALASHGTAAALHGLDGFREGRIEVTVERTVRRRPIGVTVHRHRERVAEADQIQIGGIPTTTIERTLIDVARTRGLWRAEDSLDGAEREKTAESTAVARHAEELRGRGRTRVGKFSDLAYARVGSSQPTTKLERMFLRAIDRAGIARPECQYPVRWRDGTLCHPDFAFVEERLAVEVNGRRGHASDHDRQRDGERLIQFQLLGWKVLPFTYRDVRERPDWVVRQVELTLQDLRTGLH